MAGRVTVAVNAGRVLAEKSASKTKGEAGEIAIRHPPQRPIFLGLVESPADKIASEIASDCYPKFTTCYPLFKLNTPIKIW